MRQQYPLPTLGRALGLGVGLFLTDLSSFAQQTKPDSQQTIWIHDALREAQFPGGHRALSEYLRQHVHYPAEAAKADITGKVFASFVIDTTGYISDITILKGLGYGYDEEEIRVINMMPRWQPSTRSGRPIRVKYNLPIVFTRQ